MPSLARHRRPYGSLHAADAISDGVSLPSWSASGAAHPGFVIPVMLPPNRAPNLSPIAGLYRATATEPQEKGDDQEGNDKGAPSELSCSARPALATSSSSPPLGHLTNRRCRSVPHHRCRTQPTDRARPSGPLLHRRHRERRRSPSPSRSCQAPRRCPRDLAFSASRPVCGAAYQTLMRRKWKVHRRTHQAWVQRRVVAADGGEDVTVVVSKVRMLVPQPRLADTGVTVAMLVTTTAAGRRR